MCCDPMSASEGSVNEAFVPAVRGVRSALPKARDGSVEGYRSAHECRGRSLHVDHEGLQERGEGGGWDWWRECTRVYRRGATGRRSGFY
eukprot:COSAG02_NODE_265_length_26599_cov_13.943698_2_plen_89_part_00